MSPALDFRGLISLNPMDIPGLQVIEDDEDAADCFFRLCPDLRTHYEQVACCVKSLKHFVGIQEILL